MAQRLKDAASQFAKKMPKDGMPGGGAPKMPEAPKFAVAGAKALILAGGLGVAGYNSVYSVDGGHRAVIYNRVNGLSSKVYNEGLNFNIPWFEHPVIYDIRTRPCNLQTLTGSKDLQMVTIGVRVLHRPSVDELPWIYRRLGTDYDERVLPSIMNEVAKAVVARFNASELLTKRDVVSKEIRQELSRRGLGFKIVLEDVAITHLSFSPEYSRAVEAKQVAQQDAERAKYVVQGAKAEKQTIITRAQGEAQSTMLIGNAVKKNPGFMKLRKIEAAGVIATTVSKSGNKIYLNSDSLLLNLVGEPDELVAPKKWWGLGLI